MNISREAAVQALFLQLCKAQIFNSASRKVKLAADVEKTDMPALFLMKTKEIYERGQGIGAPAKTTLFCEALIYIADTEGQEVPSTQMNNVLDAIEATLAPDPIQTRCTLGGVVYNAWIEGEVLSVPGDLEGIGIIVVPIKVLVP